MMKFINFLIKIENQVTQLFNIINLLLSKQLNNINPKDEVDPNLTSKLNLVLDELENHVRYQAIILTGSKLTKEINKVNSFGDLHN